MRTHVLGVLAVVLLAVGPATADSSSTKLVAYYDQQMAIVSGTLYAWKGVAPPGLIPIPARQVGGERDNYYLLTREDELILFDENLDQQAVLMQQVAQFAAGDSGVLAITHDRNLWWLSGATKQFFGKRRHGCCGSRLHYNTKRPHSALGYRPPAPESIISMEEKRMMH